LPTGVALYYQVKKSYHNTIFVEYVGATFQSPMHEVQCRNLCKQLNAKQTLKYVEEMWWDLRFRVKCDDSTAYQRSSLNRKLDNTI
jgi:hypothetical protein